MKALIIFLLSISAVFAQNREADQRQFIWNLSGTTTTAYLSTIHPSNPQSVKDYFKSDKFILGWHWGGERIISKVMKVNQADMTNSHTNDANPNRYENNTNLFIRSDYHGNDLWSHCREDARLMHTKSMKYSAAITIDTIDPYNLIKLNNDPDNNIFGFRNKNVNCYDSIMNDGRYRLVVKPANVTPNTEILSNPWPNHLLTFHQTNLSDGRDTTFTGRAYYLSINLRRLENNGLDDSLVLKIEVPYTYKTGQVDDVDVFANDTAKFTKLPKGLGGNYIDTFGYGSLWELDSCSPSKKMYISRNMLPYDTAQNGDITISGYIDFAGDYPVGNHRLKNHNLSLGIGMIDQLNIKVTYMGNCKVAINWIKFETPNTKKLLNGFYDSIIKHGIQDNLTTFTSGDFLARNIRPKRFTINVEGSPINWPAERHFSKLVGNIISGSNGIALPNHYEYFINPADKWYSFSKITPSVANPFCKVNNWNPIPEWKTFGLKAGYEKRWDSGILNNLFQSEWETYLTYSDQQLTTSDFVEVTRNQDISIYRSKYHVKYTGGPISTQAYWEHIIYNNLIQDFTKGAIFQETPWFAQSFVEGPAYWTNNMWVANDPRGTRVVTGEEYKLMNWLPIILGAKGLIYDGDADVSWVSNNEAPNIRLLPSETELMTRTNLNWVQLNALSDYDYINHIKSTNDFLNNTYNHLHINPNYIDKQDIANTIGSRSHRIFMGKQSVRNEMYKIHSWIRNNEEELMNLSLKAWYGIGYKLWYLQDPKISNNPDIMSKYIDKANIKTIKFVDENGYHPEGIEESNFESFCDITILADKVNDEDMSDIFYIGAQNRRTDPFIYDEVINQYYYEEPDIQFYFISTHEFDTLTTDNGNIKYHPVTGEPKSISYWREKYWQRQGIREIRIKMKYEKPGTHDKVLLRVEELLAENEPLTNMNGTPGSTPEWWRQERWNNAIKDTVIRSDGELVLKMLPGSGRMFKVTVEKTQDIVGELANSNQTKIIAYPARQTSNQDYSGHDDSVYYLKV